MQNFYSISDVAKIFRVTRQTVMAWIKNGTIHGVKIGGVYRISEDEIKRLSGGGIANATI